MDLSKLKDIYDSVGGIDGISKGVSSVSGLFSKKGDDKSSSKNSEEGESLPQAGLYSPELERLIAMILEDDEVNDRELEMLSARAEKEGIDPFEFEITIKKRLRQKREQAERLKNPAVAIAEAFKIAEATAKGGKAIDNNALSAMLSLIPGVGQVATIGSLAASLIKTPSNINALKAEIIGNAQIPEDERYLADFMLFCHMQKEVDIERKRSDSHSLSGILSSLTMGESIDLVPIWNTKINQLISQSKRLYPDSALIKATVAQVYESPARRLRNEKARGADSFRKELVKLTAPEDKQDLLDVVVFLFENLSDDDYVKEAHKNMYKAAELRFAGDSLMMQKLKQYKVKKFGLF